MSETLTDLESRFRTPELHGSGSLRTWAFDPIGTWPVRESGEILRFFGVANEAAHSVFASVSTSVTSIEHEDGTEQVWIP